MPDRISDRSPNRDSFFVTKQQNVETTPGVAGLGLRFTPPGGKLEFELGKKAFDGFTLETWMRWSPSSVTQPRHELFGVQGAQPPSTSENPNPLRPTISGLTLLPDGHLECDVTTQDSAIPPENTVATVISGAALPPRPGHALR